MNRSTLLSSDGPTTAIGMGLFPLLDFAIVLAAGLHEHPMLAMVILPALFTAATLLIAHQRRLPAGPSVAAVFGCLLTCMMTSGIAVLFGTVDALYAGF